MNFKEWFYSASHRAKYTNDTPAYLAAQEAWEAAHEACAKVADEKLLDTALLMSMPPKSSAAWGIAAAIRARGN